MGVTSVWAEGMQGPCIFAAGLDNLKPQGMAQKLEMRAWLKQVLPPEHGSWAFVIEPLLIASIAGGPTFVLAGIGGFLLFLGYRPSLLGINDLMKERKYPRTVPSLIAGLTLNSLGLMLLVLSQQFLALVFVMALGGVFAQLDQKLPPRSLWRELAGSLMMVPVVILAAPAAWPILILRPLASVLSVRGVIDRMDDARASRWAGVCAGVLLAAAVWWFVPLGWRSAAYGVAGGRTLYLAMTHSWERRATHIGIAETAVASLIALSWIEAAGW